MDRSVREGTYYEFDGFVLDPTRRQLTFAGAAVALTPTVFDTLHYLVEHPTEVVTRDQLLDAVWPRKTVDISNVSQTIYTLRRALVEAGGPDSLIQTVPGEGYRLACPVHVQSNKTEAALPRATRRIEPRWRVAGLAVLIVAAAALGAWLLRPKANAPAASQVVLADFQNLAGEAQLERGLQAATRIDLMQSPYVQLLSDPEVSNTLSLMARPGDSALTPAVAREVCLRSNSAAVVEGSVGKVGDRYLLTLTATDCADGSPIAGEKAEVDHRDDLLPALDRLVGRIRARLGESDVSIRRFDTPLQQQRTSSLAALEVYSQAHDDFVHGRRTEAIPLLQQAIALDPSFAAAETDLGAIYANLHQDDLASAAITRAYALRNTVGAHEKLAIEARYSSLVTGDLIEELRIYRSWTELYPNDPSAWANLANKENWVGHFAPAIADARRALALGPDTETNYVVLARAQLHAGRLDEAAAVCAQAAARRVDGDDLHGLLFEIAAARGDAAGESAQLQWAAGKPGERTLLIDAGQAAFASGQVRQGLGTFQRALDLGQSFGLGDIFAAPNARLLYDLGLTSQATQALARVPAGYDSPDYRFALAEFGDERRSEELRAAAIRKTPSNTLLTEVYAAEDHAVAALRHHDPAAAIAALQSATPFEMRTFDVPYVRGEAYLAAGNGAAAQVEFRKILDNPGVEPVSEHYPLARLGLARALHLAGRDQDSRKAYDAFFAAWREADPGLPLVAAARQEYAALGQGGRR